MEPLTQIIIGLTAALNTASLLAKVVAECQATGRVPTQEETDIATTGVVDALDAMDAQLGEPPAQSSS